MKNYFIINIEGLDVSGKETLSNSLEKMIMNNMPADKKVKIIRHSFPTYDTRVGARIYDILANVPIENRNQKELDMMFAYDRLAIMSNFEKTFISNPDTFYILILDRYYMSNLIYSLAADVRRGITITESSDKNILADYLLVSTNAGRQYDMERHVLPEPNIMYMIFEKDEVGRSKHKELIESKEIKDLNESMEFQSTLNKVISNYIDPNMNKFISEDSYYRSINIGENFGNTIIEDDCVEMVKNYLICYMMQEM